MRTVWLSHFFVILMEFKILGDEGHEKSLQNRVFSKFWPTKGTRAMWFICEKSKKICHGTNAIQTKNKNYTFFQFFVRKSWEQRKKLEKIDFWAYLTEIGHDSSMFFVKNCTKSSHDKSVFLKNWFFFSSLQKKFTISVCQRAWEQCVKKTVRKKLTTVLSARLTKKIL